MSTVHGLPWEAAEVVLESKQEQKASEMLCINVESNIKPGSQDSKPFIGMTLRNLGLPGLGEAYSS